MIFINIRGVPAAFWEETPFSGVSAIYRSDIVALRMVYLLLEEIEYLLFNTQILG